MGRRNPENYARDRCWVTKPSFALYRSSIMAMPATPQEGRIQNLNQLEARQAVRRELQQQIEALTDRRGRLIQERLNAQAAGNPGVANEISAQVTELSSRIARLDRQWIDANEAIMDAVRRGVGVPQHEGTPAIPPVPAIPAIPPVPSPPGESFSLLPPMESTPWYGRGADRIILMEAVALVLLGLAFLRYVRRTRRAEPAAVQGSAEMRQALDAIAVEVERISENQRYVTKLLAERMGEAPAQAIESNAKDRVNAR